MSQMPSELAAPSSRSQRARSPTTTPRLSDLPRVVRWRPLVAVAVVTHLDTHPRSRRGGGAASIR
jgi:hypothetical protein